ncbi:MAG: MBL fold metallo-hydrolase [Methanomicrobiaceae archaeon]|nr:MBL fold metallo-hydrolase [Methanomicrobiaceae archaeon]
MRDQEIHSFVAKMPNRPGALHQAAEIITRYGGNINRINFDRRIDPQTVFFEVTCEPAAYRKMASDLEQIGYLQTSLAPPSFLKFRLFLPHQTGALFEFLCFTTDAGANIAYIDFDDSGIHPDRVTMSLDVAESSVANALLNTLKSRYRLEILEYDTTGDRLDNTVFYLRFAQKIRPLIGEAEDAFLLSFLHDINHIVQELASRGKDPKTVFRSIFETGKTLHTTIREGFYADIQQIPLPGDARLYCFQPPCGGNIFLIDSPEEQVLIDTGYGIYYPDIVDMLGQLGLREKGIARIVITHADADHCGAGGLFGVPAMMHPGTLSIIREANRAYGSRSEDSILEEVYTTMINLFSRFTPPEQYILIPEEGDGERGEFPVLERLTLGGIHFEVLGSFGGHLYGQIFLYAPETGLLFSADSLMNFASFSAERKDYNSLADFLVTSVNVDSELARTERQMLTHLASVSSTETSRPFLVCGGHGAVSNFMDGRLQVYGDVRRYTPPSRAP